MNTFELKKRTSDRSGTVWTDINPLPYMGLDNPVSVEETLLDAVNSDGVNNAIIIADDVIRIKEKQLGSTILLGHDMLANELAITKAKIATQQAIMAMQLVTNAYIITIDKYVIGVKELIADAKDYAFEIEKKKIPLALLKAEIAEEKATAKIAKIDMQILLESINRKFVDIEILRAELDVAKADVRLIMAEVGVSEAELKKVEARVTLAMTNVEKTTLLADVAMIYADIAVRALSETKYRVEAAEVEAAFGRISSVLASALATLDVKQSQISEKTALQDVLIDIANSIFAAQQAKINIQLDRASSLQAVLAHEASETTAALMTESTLKSNKLASDQQIDNSRADGNVDIDSIAVIAASIVKEVHTNASRHSTNLVEAKSTIAQAISRG